MKRVTKSDKIRDILQKDWDRKDAQIAKDVGATSGLVNQIRKSLREQREKDALLSERNGLAKNKAYHDVIDRTMAAAEEGDRQRDAERAETVTLPQMWKAREFAESVGGVGQAIFILTKLRELSHT